MAEGLWVSSRLCLSFVSPYTQRATKGFVPSAKGGGEELAMEMVSSTSHFPLYFLDKQVLASSRDRGT